MTCRECRARRDERVTLVVRVEPCSNMADDEEAVYKFCLLRSGFAVISGTTSGKSEVDM